MAQHFLLSAASRTTSLRAIYKAGEDAAYATFCQMRWPETDGEAVCPVCSNHDTYKITTRRKFKCKNCHHQFSVTSGTLAHDLCPHLIQNAGYRLGAGRAHFHLVNHRPLITYQRAGCLVRLLPKAVKPLAR